MRAARPSFHGLLLSALLGVFLGVGTYAFNYAEGLSYLSNDPAACVNCHIMREQHDGWQKGSHHAVATCNDCHVPQAPLGRWVTKVEHGFRHSKGFTLQDFHEPIRITPGSLAIVQRNCLRCHGGFLDEVTTHAAASGEVPECVHCHGGVGHGPQR